MNTHELKCLPGFYRDIITGRKRFEIRKNDRDFKLGDIVILRLWKQSNYMMDLANPNKPVVGEWYYPAVRCSFQITYILDHAQYPEAIHEDYCILGFERVWNFDTCETV